MFSNGVGIASAGIPILFLRDMLVPEMGKHAFAREELGTQMFKLVALSTVLTDDLSTRRTIRDFVYSVPFRVRGIAIYEPFCL